MNLNHDDSNLDISNNNISTSKVQGYQYFLPYPLQMGENGFSIFASSKEKGSKASHNEAIGRLAENVTHVFTYEPIQASVATLEVATNISCQISKVLHNSGATILGSTDILKL